MIRWHLEDVIEKPLDIGMVMWNGQLEIEICSSLWGQHVKMAYGPG